MRAVDAAGQPLKADSSPTPPSPAATVDLDLAFTVEGVFAPELVKAAGPWAELLTGADHWHGLLEHWLSNLAAELPPKLQASAYSLGLSLVGDDEIAALNADWRNKPGPTDVLAFAAQDDDLDDAPPMPLPPSLGTDINENDSDWDEDEHEKQYDEYDDETLKGETAEIEPLELGDIVISLHTAYRQAVNHGHSLEHELHFLASHGLLHLLGWDHPDEGSLAAMISRQSQLLDIPARHPA